MNVLADLHGAVPNHLAGAEWTVHEILTHLAAQGHSCTALNRVHAPTRDSYHLDGVRIIDHPTPDQASHAYERADIIITHLDQTRQATLTAKRYHRPLVYLVHNHSQLRHHSALDAQLLVYNSRHLASASPYPGIIVHPPVQPVRYQTTRGQAVTLMNLSARKGASIFYELAAENPTREFLGVLGAYDPQVLHRPQPNVTIAHPARDARRVYERTRVLLMPSSYESYGRCAVEAACSGIPTIHSPQPGFGEGIATSGIRAITPTDYQEALHLLDSEWLYEPLSRDAKQRAGECWQRSLSELSELSERLARLAG